MRVILFLAAVASAMLCVSTQASEVLVGFYTLDALNNPPDVFASGFSGGVAMDNPGGSGGPRGTESSSDGTFGPSISTGAGDSAAVSATANGAFALRSGDSRANIFVQNNSTEEYFLNSIVWDHFVANYQSNGSNSWTLSYLSGNLDGINPFTVIGSDTTANNPEAFQGFPGGLLDYQDYEVDLNGLPDNILAPGEFATFQLRELGSSGPPMFVDNIAIIGKQVPEPSSVLLVLGGLLGLAGLQRCTK